MCETASAHKHSWERQAICCAATMRWLALLCYTTLFTDCLIRGVSEKYPTWVHISALVLFFVIRAVVSFEVVPIWSNHTLPAVLPHLKAVLERRFWNGLQLARRITQNRLDFVEPLSFERHLQFWEHPKVAGNYVGTVQKLAKLCNLVFRQKLLHKVRWLRWRVIVVKKPVTPWPETRSFSSHGITQSFQNFNVIFFVDRLTSWSKFIVHNALTIEKNNQRWLDMAPTLTYFWTACTTPFSVLCPYFRPQRPSVLFQSSPYNSFRDWSKT